MNYEIKRRELIKNAATSLGYLLTAGSMSSLLSACAKGEQNSAESEGNSGQDTAARSALLSPHQMHNLRILCDIILPETDTPGAIAAGVPEFIASIVQDVFTLEDQNKFNDGLFSLDLFCTGVYQKNYVDLPEHKHKKIAQHLNLAAYKKDSDIKKVLQQKSQLDDKAIESAVHYFSLVKQLTVFGFYTSEVGATQVLQYNPIPGRFDGCVPLEDIGKAWATRR